LVLADLFPEKHDDILAIGHSLGWHCVEIARHYPTDIYAGRVFAQAIVREMKDNPDFQRDLAEVKSEIEASKHSAQAPAATLQPEQPRTDFTPRPSPPRSAARES
jgi:hypothetical protein